MVNETFAARYDAPPRLENNVLAAIGFFALALLVFVGYRPFNPPPALAAAGAGEGNLVQQLMDLCIFALVFVTTLQRRGWMAVRAIPPWFLLLQLWCLLSALWSDAHGVSFRRAALEAMLSCSILMSAGTIGPERAFRYLRIILAAVLVVNWISIPLIPAAIHQANEIDPSLIGDWRGLYGQKNATGAVCVITVLTFLLSRNGKYNWIGWLVSLGALAFLVMTRSKTSLALLPVALVAGLAYCAAWRDGLSRAIFTVFAALLILAALVAGIFYADTISHILEDPTEFTGRAEIWQAYLSYARDHVWLGAGFGTLTDTGALSPVHNYVLSSWVEAIGNSHDGYLQVLVTLGGVGFVLAIIALVIMPLAGFWPLDYSGSMFRGLLFAIFVFFIFHNFLESDLLERESQAWFSALLVMAALRNPDKSLTLAP
jgi:exopolysaccharide production protein ExoQ